MCIDFLRERRKDNDCGINKAGWSIGSDVPASIMPCSDVRPDVVRSTWRTPAAVQRGNTCPCEQHKDIRIFRSSDLSVRLRIFHRNIQEQET